MSNAVSFDLSRAVEANKHYLFTVLTSRHMQLTLMMLRPGESTERETHEGVDQFFKVEKGNGELRTKKGVTKFQEGWCLLIQAGTEHQLINTGVDPLHVFSIYSAKVHDSNAVENKDPHTGQVMREF